MNNQTLANVLYANHLATKEQLEKYWALVDEEHNIAWFLQKAGLLSQDVYDQVIDFVRQMEQSDPALNPKETEQPSPVTEDLSTQVVEKKPQETIAAEDENPTSTSAFALEGNNPFQDEPVSDPKEDPTDDDYTVEGLQETRLSDFTPITFVEKKSSSAPGKGSSDSGQRAGIAVAMPNDWIFESGQGSVAQAPPSAVGPQSSLGEWLYQARKSGFRKLWLIPGNPMVAEKKQEMISVHDHILKEHECRRWCDELQDGLMTGMAVRERNTDMSSSFALNGLGRFVAHIHWSQKGPGIVVELVEEKIPEWSEAQLPEVVKDWCQIPNGLIVISSDPQAGMKRALPVLVQRIRRERNLPVHWIETPIRYLYGADGSAVIQRQPGMHTPSLLQGIRTARQLGMGVLVVQGVSRLEEVLECIDAVFAGMLVLMEWPGQSCLELLDSLVVQTHSNRKHLINLLSHVLRGMLVQHRIEADQELFAYDYLPVDSIVRTSIAAQDWKRIRQIQMAEHATLDDALQRLLDRGALPLEQAQSLSTSPDRLTAFFGDQGL